MASPFYAGDIEQPVALRSVWNATTTVAYGQTMVFGTTTIIDAASDYPLVWGREATLATNTEGGAFPAGLYWGLPPTNASHQWQTGTNLSANQGGFVICRGVHVQAYIYGSVTYGDILYASGASPGSLFASNTYSASLTVVGRSLFTAASTTTHQQGIYVHLGAS